ncbi:hypothetical protein [Thermomonas sp.]
MSIFKKNVLAAALVAGLVAAGSAGAYTYWTAGDTAAEKVATASVVNSSSIVTMTQDVQVRVDAVDLVVGRTTGFQVRFNLFNGGSGSIAKFAANPAPTAGADLPAGWVVTLAAGGTGATFAVYNIVPPNSASVPGIVPGELFKVVGTSLTDVEELATAGGIISSEFFFADPVGAAVINGSLKQVNLLVSANPVQLACDKPAGDTTSRIDVADTTAAGGKMSKTWFSKDGSLGGANSTTNGTKTFDFGNISASKDAAFGSFNYLSTDTFKTVLNGGAGNDFSAFSNIYLSNNNCASAITNGNGVISGSTVTFNYSLADAVGNASGYTLAVCGTVNGTSVIDDVPVITSTTTFSRAGTLSPSPTTCELLPLLYNGSVVEIYHINPAGNSTAQSFVRVINRSNTGGKVTLHGIDDAGNSPGTDITFFLGAQKSMQLNSDDLERGNPAKGLTGAWGDGAGKWRAILTAEFSGVRVQGLNRNANDGTVTNLTDADGRGEQAFEAQFDN